MLIFQEMLELEYIHIGSNFSNIQAFFYKIVCIFYQIDMCVKIDGFQFDTLNKLFAIQWITFSMLMDA